MTGKCSTCGIEFSYFQSSRSGRFCSRKCLWLDEHYRNKNKVVNLGRKASPESKKKMSLSRKGVPKPSGFGDKIRSILKKTWDKKGRKSDLYTLIKSSKEFRNWKQSVISKSHGKCVKCGVRPSKIDAHHLVPFSILVEELKLGLASMESINDPDNGIAVCRKCHLKLHPGGTRWHQLPETRLFSLIKKQHNQLGICEPFPTFYRRQMESIIDNIKTKLSPQ